jgi:signal transduction histidine kinase
VSRALRSLAAACRLGFALLLVAGPARAASEPDWARLEAAYQTQWRELASRAELASSRLPMPPLDDAGRSRAFEELAALVENEPGRRSAILLLDGDGVAQAWAGTGLLQEPPARELPRRGLDYRVGFASATLVAVVPLGEATRPWRVVAGVSLPTDHLPAGWVDETHSTRYRWSLLDTTVVSAAPATGRRTVSAPGAPMLLVEAQEAPPEPARGLPWGRLGLGLLGLALAAVSARGFTGRAASGGSRWRAALPGLAAVLPLALATGASGPAALFALAGCAVAAAAWVFGGRLARLGASGLAVVAGLFAATAAAWLFQLGHRQWDHGSHGLGAHGLGPIDLGATLIGSAEEMCLRLGLTAFVAGALGLAAVRPTSAPPSRRARFAWVALLVALTAGTLLAESPLLALAALAGVGLATTSWLASRPASPGVSWIAAFLALASLAAALCWEVPHRALARAELGERLAWMGPPSPGQLAALALDIERELQGLDLAELVLRPLEGVDRRDLAYSLWRRSPLAHKNALSALVIEPEIGNGEETFFAFGLPLDEQQRFDPASPAWRALSLPPWDELSLAGEVQLLAAGVPWGRARWWLVPRPGFRLGEEEAPGQLLVELLRGSPGDPRSPDGLPKGVLYALYPQGTGPALTSPWPGQPPPRSAVLEGGSDVRRVRAPSGPAWVAAREAEDGIEALFLPALSGLTALERLGNFAASVAWFLAAAAALLLVLALPRPAMRELVSRATRSYARRLILVYAALLLVPFLLLNVVLLRTVQARLDRDQRSGGEQALAAAKREVAERIAREAPGFVLDTLLSTQYLDNLARLVDHDVNVYFESEQIAASSAELFAAGLLPRRIPGEVFSRLALEEGGLASRLDRSFTPPFLELYSPVELPGEPASANGIVLSVPLLAQQEEAAGVLEALSRRALVVSTALLGLLFFVGGRLASSFTRPIQQLVDGTRRIAAGAPSLEVRPTELELAALGRAIDDMAGRIAAAREALLREKKVAEQMVEHITSGVVSLDADGRVLLRNRMAAELLGVTIGERLVDRLAERPELEAVRAFVRAAEERETAQPSSGSARLAAAAGEREWALVWVPLPGEGEPSAILVVEDVTEVFRGQRLAAWAEMARIIAHEIKNPLTPIRLTTEHLRRVHEGDRAYFDEIFDRCTVNILRQVDELQLIASEFSTYSRIPRMEARDGDLRGVLASLVEAYQAAPPPGIEVRHTSPPEPVAARFDEKLLSRALRNLLENAVRASSVGGVVEVALELHGDLAVILVADRGPGVPPELLARIFDPYFSTHDSGTGLGLPIARRIAEEHGGSIGARNREGGGLAVEIRIPLR